MVFHLHVRIYLRDLFLVLLNFQCLLLTELAPLIALLAEAVGVEGLLGELLDLNLVAVAVEDAFLDLFEPAWGEEYLNL